LLSFIDSLFSWSIHFQIVNIEQSNIIFIIFDGWWHRLISIMIVCFLNENTILFTLSDEIMFTKHSKPGSTPGLSYFGNSRFFDCIELISLKWYELLNGMISWKRNFYSSFVC
jgi:hypothetical protein